MIPRRNWRAITISCTPPKTPQIVVGLCHVRPSTNRCHSFRVSGIAKKNSMVPAPQRLTTVRAYDAPQYTKSLFDKSTATDEQHFMGIVLLSRRIIRFLTGLAHRKTLLRVPEQIMYVLIDRNRRDNRDCKTKIYRLANTHPLHTV